jgi:transcriptional regulator with AAA-type ATPase domain
VLVYGERGTGREMVTHLIHHTANGSAPLVTFDCGNLSGEELLLG